MQKGKFIVIDGTDGSGKGTQTDLLITALKAEGKDVVKIEFPRHSQPSAWFVDQYLNGKFGSISEVGPYQASVFYALDRYAVATEIKKYLQAGVIVIADRYVTSNLGHQGAKIENLEERKEFYDWINNFEYNKLKIPQPDLTIILHMPAEVAQKLVDKKGHRDYIGGSKRDLHESDLEHLKKAEQVYSEIAKQFDNICMIECYEDNTLLTKQTIHNKIIEKSKQII